MVAGADKTPNRGERPARGSLCVPAASTPSVCAQPTAADRRLPAREEIGCPPSPCPADEPSTQGGYRRRASQARHRRIPGSRALRDLRLRLVGQRTGQGQLTGRLERAPARRSRPAPLIEGWPVAQTGRRGAPPRPPAEEPPPRRSLESRSKSPAWRSRPPRRPSEAAASRAAAIRRVVAASRGAPPATPCDRQIAATDRGARRGPRRAGRNPLSSIRRTTRAR